MIRVRFIINPISGVGRQKIMPGLIDSVIDRSKCEVDLVYTEAPKHATELAKQAAEEQIDIVAIVGGDGSVNEVGSALLHSKTAMAIIPTGSGNGLARHLKIPLALKDAVALLNQHKIVKIDTGLFDNQPFMGVAGIGFDALIAWEFSRFGKRGFFSYFRIVLREYFKYRSEIYKVKFGESTLSHKAFLLTAANSSQYGNRATIAPQANLFDGKLKICLLRRFSLFQAPFVAWRLFNRTIHNSRFMTVLEGTEFDIEKQQKLGHLDGEPIEIEGSLKIKVQPASLNMVVPV